MLTTVEFFQVLIGVGYLSVSVLTLWMFFTGRYVGDGKMLLLAVAATAGIQSVTHFLSGFTSGYGWFIHNVARVGNFAVIGVLFLGIGMLWLAWRDKVVETQHIQEAVEQWKYPQ